MILRWRLRILREMSDIQPCRSEEYPSNVRRPHYSVLDKKLVKDTFGVKIPHWRASLAEVIRRMEKGD